MEIKAQYELPAAMQKLVHEEKDLKSKVTIGNIETVLKQRIFNSYKEGKISFETCKQELENFNK